MEFNGKKDFQKKTVKGQTIYIVEESDELLKFLFAKMPERSKKTVKSLLSNKQISVAGKVVTQFNHLLQKGQEVIVNSGTQLKEKIKGLKILFEDDSIIIIDKDAGILSVATEIEKENTAFRILSEHVKKEDPENKIFVIHRLDRDTSGVMMYAKNQNIQNILQKDWNESIIERSYIALVEGQVHKKEDTIISWLNENKSLIMYSSKIAGDGQKAVTKYKLLKSNKNYSLLEVQLETGRKNQIRVHMKDIGHSIAGDKKYGSNTNPIKRLGLHAYTLTFKHPLTGENVSFTSEIPAEFNRMF
jgi:23S rRNA pseudouridine1911/1915/1917 synthase